MGREGQRGYGCRKDEGWVELKFLLGVFVSYINEQVTAFLEGRG
jgi:hypothetical protein